MRLGFSSGEHRPPAPGCLEAPLPRLLSKERRQWRPKAMPLLNHSMRGHLSWGRGLRLTLWFLQSPTELWRSLCTEKYSPVSTTYRSPITRQKVIWHQGGEMNKTAGPNRRSREMKKNYNFKVEIWRSNQVPSGESFWGHPSQGLRPRQRADRWPGKSSEDLFLILPSQVKHRISISRRVTLGLSVLRNINRSYRGGRFCGHRHLANALWNLV